MPLGHTCNNNWISRRGSLKPLGEIHVPGVTKVSDLLNSHGTDWDVPKVTEMFTPEDAHDIMQINIGGPNVEDYLAWNFTKNGIFTVRSAYHLGMAFVLSNTS